MVKKPQHNSSATEHSKSHVVEYSQN